MAEKQNGGMALLLGVAVLILIVSVVSSAFKTETRPASGSGPYYSESNTQSAVERLEARGADKNLTGAYREIMRRER
jgi:hypothetical protein